MVNAVRIRKLRSARGAVNLALVDRALEATFFVSAKTCEETDKSRRAHRGSAGASPVAAAGARVLGPVSPAGLPTAARGRPRTAV
jgi:hypothetical protein